MWYLWWDSWNHALAKWLVDRYPGWILRYKHISWMSKLPSCVKKAPYILEKSNKVKTTKTPKCKCCYNDYLDISHHTQQNLWIFTVYPTTSQNKIKCKFNSSVIRINRNINMQIEYIFIQTLSSVYSKYSQACLKQPLKHFQPEYFSL